MRDYYLKSFKKDFIENLLLMKNIGLIYNNPIKLAYFLNKGNDVITDWWYSSKFQISLNKIKKDISKHEKNPIDKLSNILISKIN